MANTAKWSGDPKSLKDAAYQAARSIEGVESAAKYIRTLCPTFADDQPAEVMEQLDAGWLLRFSELNPVKMFYLTDDGKTWVELAQGAAAPEKAAKREIGVIFAMSYTPQAYGTLKNTDPSLHAIMKPLRDAFSKYRSNRKGDIIRYIRKAERMESGENPRAATKAFADFVSDTLSNLVTRCKNAKARGDDTANLDLLNKQIAAFKGAK